MIRIVSFIAIVAVVQLSQIQTVTAGFLSANDWNGSWQGPVIFNMNDGEEVRDCAAEVRINSDEAEVGMRIILSEGCGWDLSLLFTREESKLIYNDRIAGDILATEMSFGPIVIDDFGVNYSLNLFLQPDGSLIMKEYTEFSPEVSDRVTGTLKPN